MNEGTPSGSEYNKPWAAVLKCPNAELYLYLNTNNNNNNNNKCIKERIMMGNKAY
jgi:hypothetical protein